MASPARNCKRQAGRLGGGKLRAIAAIAWTRRKIAPRAKRFRAAHETALKQTPRRSCGPPEIHRRWRDTARRAATQKETTVSTAALLRNPSRTSRGLGAVSALGSSILRFITTRIRTGRDARVLQTLPEHVLADMGLQKMEILSGTHGSRHVWVIPHRYY